MDRYIWTLWTGKWDKPKLWDLMCYAVSVGFVRKFCGNVEIYSDKNGIDMLREYGIDAEFKLVDFDIEDTKVPKFAEAKLKVIGMQTSPFIHLDHDAFLLKPQIDDKSSDIVVQNKEDNAYHKFIYRRSYMLGKSQEKEGSTTIWPAEIVKCADETDFTAYNCGYLAVNNTDVSRQWCSDALTVSGKFTPTRREDNAIVEQMTLYAFSKYRGYQIKCLFDSTEANQLEPEMAGYVHLMNDKVTDRIYVTRRLMQRAKEVAPAFYEKCFPHLLEI